MEFVDVVEIIKPQPDTQYRLVPCRCGSGEVVYAKYLTGCGEKWRVVCTDCGKTVDKGTAIRHEAQVAWNNEINSK